MTTPNPNPSFHPSPLLALLFASLFVTSSAAAAGNTTAPFNQPYRPADSILLNCGAAGDSNDTDGRAWRGDAGSEYSPTLSSPGAEAATQHDAPAVPYLTARVFTSPFTYSFPLAPGRHYLRLHFYPSNYSSSPSAAASAAVFSVTAGAVTLLRNFSAYQTAAALNYAYLSREFSLNATSSPFNLTFTPSNSSSFAFVNGIEIVSTPDLFSAAAPLLVPNGIPYDVAPTLALETVYRLNVGGQSISPSADSGLDRSWADDSPYIYGAGFGVSYSADENVTIQYSAALPLPVAPADVYATARSMGPDIAVNQAYNLTWIFTVDSGFSYWLRFHFCEIQYPITRINQRVFDVFINNQTAERDADVIAWGEGIGKPVYKDYVTNVPGEGQADLWVALHPSAAHKPQFYDAILNGLEIFKIQNGDGNLAGPNPAMPPPQPLDVVTDKPNRRNIASPIAGVVVGAAVAALLSYLLYRRRQRKGAGDWLPLFFYNNTPPSYSSKDPLPSSLCRHFSFAEIVAATNGFDEARILGVGGFGKVYRGEIDGGSTKVAVKRGNPLSEQGIHEFQTEIEMLSKLRHRHLVSLIGYCNEKNEMILVYDYMGQGTLREHLCKAQKPPLPWKKRLEICIGAAKGLHYLHTGAKFPIIHRDVKTTNILLDDKLVSKVSDFGLSKTGPAVDNTHVSTVVKGSFGYLDPEYFRRQQLTEKSDVYSFGVVLFEVMCARPALCPALAKEEVSLAEWAVRCSKKGVLSEILDPYLKGRIDGQCFNKFAETAEKCVADNGIERPAMGDVLWSLELALRLQESAEETGGAMMGGDGGPLLKGKKKDHGDSLESSTATSSVSIGGRGKDEMTPSVLFSQIVNPHGR